jgi:hypothetical protein
MTQAGHRYELITERAGRPVIMTLNRVPADWYPSFPSSVVANSSPTGSSTPRTMSTRPDAPTAPEADSPAPKVASFAQWDEGGPGGGAVGRWEGPGPTAPQPTRARVENRAGRTGDALSVRPPCCPDAILVT